MSDVKTLKSYLVGLGFAVDAQQYKQFNNTLTDAAKGVEMNTAKIGTTLIKWQVGIIGLFTTVSTAILGTMDRFAQADQDYRLFGERMFMSTNNARSLKIALDALGQPMEAIAFDPELHERFMQLQKDQAVMGRGVGGDFESQMRGIRDMSFQITRLKVELQYLAMGTVSNIFKTVFGDGDVLKKMKEWNEWLINNIPTLSKQLSSYLAPILKDTFIILKDVVKLLGVMGLEFSNLVGIFSNDSSLEGTAFSFDKLARSVGKVVGWMATLMDFILKIETKLPILEILGGAAGGAAIGSVVPGVGTGIGAVVGGGAAGIMSLIGRMHGQSGSDNAANASQSVSDQVRELAGRIGRDLGVDPALVYGQFAHETGNFTNRGTKDLHNLGGIRIPGSTQYRDFASFDDFGKYYEDQISRNYRGVFGAKTPEAWAHALKNGRIGAYYEGSEEAYGKGMRNFMPGYNGGSVSIGQINIMQPNASAEEIAQTVASKVQQQQGKQQQRNLTELSPVFQ